MSRIITLVTFALLVAGSNAFAQSASLPTTQPSLLQIIREEVKIGHAADHVKTEVGWPAAFEKAKFPYYSLALVSLTGGSEAWFVVPYDSHAAMADEMKRSSDDPVLAAELARLARADAEHITSVRSIHAMARKDLSHGAYPDVAKQRFFEVTIMRVRPGHQATFAAAAKAYAAAAGRSPAVNYRIYEVVAGMPGPTYLIFSSTTSFGDFDKVMAAGEATMKGATAEERATLEKFGKESLLNEETHRFRVDPEMSYVPKEVRAEDPAFWLPKKPAAKTSTQP
jgi:hypothetical protein